MKKILAVVLAVAVVVAGIVYFIWESGSYVAKVGSRKIENHEYTFFLRAQKKATETEATVTGKEDISALWDTPVEGEDPKTIVMNQALENAKEFKIQLINAEQDKFKLSEAERKEIMQYLETTLKNESNINYIKNDLGLTLAQFKDMMLKSELVSRYSYNFIQKNRGHVTVTDEETKAWYEKNRQSIDEITVTQIFISTNPQTATEEQIKEREKLAEDLFQRIEQGEDMVQLAREYSEEPAAKENGGIGTFTYEEAVSQGVEKAFADWAFQADIGDLGIVKTELGFHIIKLEGKKTYEEKKEAVRTTLTTQKLNEYYYNQVQEWIKDPAFNLVKNEKVLNNITQKTFVNQ